MSVHTIIEFSELEEFLKHYSLGTLKHFEGVYPGVTNTIYAFTTEQGKYILTLFEELKYSELTFYIELINYFADQGLPTPRVIPDRNGTLAGTLKNKPAVAMEFLLGNMIEHASKEQCYAIGKALGELHSVGRLFPQKPVTTKGSQWREQSAEKLYPVLSSEDAALLRSEIAFHKMHAFTLISDPNTHHKNILSDLTMPQGIIHADLFRENVLFTGNQLTGLLDFYYACYDYLLYDLAVVINDWCIHEDFSLDKEKIHEVIRGYETYRILTDEEKKHFNTMLRLAALRFWLSRLLDFHFTPKKPNIKSKDPNEFKMILLKHIQ
ncbi:MAG: homoserine kinase [Proteobacteria bacterium]|nr:homoserine kinase [Pseudomonadota bacterium]